MSSGVFLSLGIYSSAGRLRPGATQRLVGPFTAVSNMITSL